MQPTHMQGNVMSKDSTQKKLLQINDLKVHFKLDQGTVRAVDGVSYDIDTNQIVGIIGESGCGKTVTAQAILRIVPPPGKIVAGSVILHSNGDKIDIAKLDPFGKPIRQIRGDQISMVFQEPMTSFSPVHTIGNQITESIRLHRSLTKSDATDVAIEMLERVGIPNAASRINSYPFELSGGMRQRAMIAMALVTRPKLLVADEPTTALDVTIQAQILELMQELQQKSEMSILLITHDLGVVAEVCHRVAVMYLGRIVEAGDVKTVFAQPLHPYTRALMKSIPRVSGRVGKLEMIRGSVPDPFTKLLGCPFFPRCNYGESGKCNVGSPPPLDEVRPGHLVACPLYEKC